MIRSANNFDRQENSLSTMRDPTTWDDPIVAVQDNSTDINIIGRNIMQSGILQNIDLTPLTNFDPTDVEDYGDMLRKIAAANSAFMRLPPEIRAKFDNDAQKAQAALSGMSPEETMELFKNGEVKAPVDGGTTTAAQPGPEPSGTSQPGSPGTGGTPPAAAAGAP